MDLPSSNPTTSRAAAESMREAAPIQRERILRALRAAGELGLTRDQLEAITGMNPSSLRPRVIELMGGIDYSRKGKPNGDWFNPPKLLPCLVVETDRTRPTRSNRQAKVLVAAEYAQGVRS